MNEEIQSAKANLLRAAKPWRMQRSPIIELCRVYMQVSRCQHRICCDLDTLRDLTKKLLTLTQEAEAELDYRHKQRNWNK